MNDSLKIELLVQKNASEDFYIPWFIADTQGLDSRFSKIWHQGIVGFFHILSQIFLKKSVINKIMGVIIKRILMKGIIKKILGIVNKIKHVIMNFN